MFVIRKKLSATEGISETQRWDETAEEFQISYDGGATWVDSPESDPRNNPALINPETSDQCDAAQGFSNFVRLFVDSTYEAFNVVGITSAAISIGLLWLPGINLFWKIAQIVADGILAIGATTLAATFDEDTYDQIRDIAYCYIDATGHFDQEAFDGIGAALQTEIGGSAFNITMALMYNLYGLVGFANASIDLAEGADCSGAVCTWGYTWSFDGTYANFVHDSSIAVTDGHLSAGGIAADNAGYSCPGFGTIFDAGLKSPAFDLEAGSTITKLKYFGTVDGGNSCLHKELWVGTNRTQGLTPGRLQIYINGASGSPLEVTGEITSGTDYVIGVGMNNGGDKILAGISLEGTGTMPAFSGGTPYTP